MISPLLVLVSGLMWIAAPDDEWSRVQHEFQEAFQGSEMQPRIAAIRAVVALGDPRGVGLLRTDFESLNTYLRRRGLEYRNLKATLGRRRRLAEIRRKRLAKRIERCTQKEERELLEIQSARVEQDLVAIAKREASKLEPLGAELARDSEVLEAFRSGFATLMAALPAGRRQRETQAIRRAAQSALSWEMRASAVECYALCGDPGAADVLLKLIAKLLKDKAKVERDVPNLSDKLRKALKLLNNELKTQGGRVYRTTMDRVQQLQNQLRNLSARIFASTRSIEAVGEALPLAVSSMNEAARAKALNKLRGACTSGPIDARYAALRALGRIGDPRAIAVLRDLLTRQSDPGIRTLVIDALAEQGDAGCLQELLEVHLRDPRWEVRSAVIRALTRIRSKESIPPLLVALETERGRLQEEVEQALHALTGKSFHRNVALWKRWWHDEREGFELAAAAPETTDSGPAEGAGARFYGIEVYSQRVVFVLDCSGSMGFALDAIDDPSRSSDPRYRRAPGKGESSRFDIALQELYRAIGGVPDGGTFDVVFYAQDVFMWQPKMVTMDTGARMELRTYITKKIQPQGSTNIHGGLKAAFDLAGIGAHDRYYDSKVDTIFFLSDGHPTAGEMVDRELLLEYVRRRNKLGKIIIHAVGMGEDHDAIFLRRLAEENGGRYVAR